jgi:hypothetical protein
MLNTSIPRSAFVIQAVAYAVTGMATQCVVSVSAPSPFCLPHAFVPLPVCQTVVAYRQALRSPSSDDAARSQASQQTIDRSGHKMTSQAGQKPFYLSLPQKAYSWIHRHSHHLPLCNSQPTTDINRPPPSDAYPSLPSLHLCQPFHSNRSMASVLGAPNFSPKCTFQTQSPHQGKPPSLISAYFVKICKNSCKFAQISSYSNNLRFVWSPFFFTRITNNFIKVFNKIGLFSLRDIWVGDENQCIQMGKAVNN